jgi:hypothetical protein
VTAQPAPDAVTAALDRLERPTIASRVSCPARRDGCDCINCMDRDECSIQDDIRALTAARSAHAATVKELADANALLARIADEAASTQNTARRTEGQMPLIDCRLIADVFRYVGARKAGQ